MKSEPLNSRRISLTKRQVAEETGAALLALLNDILADGKLTDGEISRLHEWLDDHRSADLPAVGFLAEAVESIIAKGLVSEADKHDLHLAIERVLPITERGISKAARLSAEPPPELPPPISKEDLKDMAASASHDDFREPPRPNWRSDGMTEPQLHFIKSLGGSIRSSATKGEASDLIESLLHAKPPTNRQQMVMRFWAHSKQDSEGPREISEWMDAFYSEDPDRKTAWELFKQEAEDDGLQGDPMRVPMGVGPQYLKRVKEGGADAIPRFRRANLRVACDGVTPRRQIVVEAEPSSATYTFAAIIGALAIAVVVYVVVVSQNSPRKQAMKTAINPIQPTSAPERTAENNPVIPSPRAATPATVPEQSLPPKPRVQDPTTVYVMELKLGGFIGGRVPRVMIGGNLYRTGDLIDPQNEITVTRIDPENRLAEFTDSTGKTIRRVLE